MGREVSDHQSIVIHFCLSPCGAAGCYVGNVWRLRYDDAGVMKRRQSEKEITNHCLGCCWPCRLFSFTAAKYLSFLYRPLSADVKQQQKTHTFETNFVSVSCVFTEKKKKEEDSFFFLGGWFDAICATARRWFPRSSQNAKEIHRVNHFFFFLFIFIIPSQMRAERCSSFNSGQRIHITVYIKKR